MKQPNKESFTKFLLNRGGKDTLCIYAENLAFLGRNASLAWDQNVLSRKEKKLVLKDIHRTIKMIEELYRKYVQSVEHPQHLLAGSQEAIDYAWHTDRIDDLYDAKAYQKAWDILQVLDVDCTAVA